MFNVYVRNTFAQPISTNLQFYRFRFISCNLISIINSEYRSNSVFTYINIAIFSLVKMYANICNYFYIVIICISVQILKFKYISLHSKFIIIAVRV